MSLGIEITEERFELMGSDLEDLPVARVLEVIVGWRRGVLQLDDPEDMNRFPKTPELRRLASRPGRRYVDIEAFRRERE